MSRSDFSSLYARVKSGNHNVPPPYVPQRVEFAVCKRCGAKVARQVEAMDAHESRCGIHCARVEDEEVVDARKLKLRGEIAAEKRTPREYQDPKEEQLGAAPQGGRGEEEDADVGSLLDPLSSGATPKKKTARGDSKAAAGPVDSSNKATTSETDPATNAASSRKAAAADDDDEKTPKDEPAEEDAKDDELPRRRSRSPHSSSQRNNKPGAASSESANTTDSAASRVLLQRASSSFSEMSDELAETELCLRLSSESRHIFRDDVASAGPPEPTSTVGWRRYSVSFGPGRMGLEFEYDARATKRLVVTRASREADRLGVRPKDVLIGVGNRPVPRATDPNAVHRHLVECERPVVLHFYRLHVRRVGDDATESINGVGHTTASRQPPLVEPSSKASDDDDRQLVHQKKEPKDDPLLLSARDAFGGSQRGDLVRANHRVTSSSSSEPRVRGSFTEDENAVDDDRPAIGETTPSKTTEEETTQSEKEDQPPKDAAVSTKGPPHHHHHQGSPSSGGFWLAAAVWERLPGIRGHHGDDDAAQGSRNKERSGGEDHPSEGDDDDRGSAAARDASGSRWTYTPSLLVDTEHYRVEDDDDDGDSPPREDIGVGSSSKTEEEDDGDSHHWPCLLNGARRASLATQLKPVLRSKAWTLLYDSACDGMILEALYNRAKTRDGPQLLLVRDDMHHVAGAFVDETIRNVGDYFGTGECFVFECPDGDASSSSSREAAPRQRGTLVHQQQGVSSSKKPSSAGSNELVVVHRWVGPVSALPPSSSSGGAPLGAVETLHDDDDDDGSHDVGPHFVPSSIDNDMFVYASNEVLGFGSGGGGFAIRLDEALEYGASRPCATYGNDHSLFAGRDVFPVQRVQLWAFASQWLS